MQLHKPSSVESHTGQGGGNVQRMKLIGNVCLQHPDTSLMKETVDEVVRRFHAQMDHVPLLSLYDSDKGVALKVPKEHFEHHFTQHDT